MAKFFVVLAACVAIVSAVPYAEDDVQQARAKRGGYIERHGGASLGGQRVRGPAAVLTGGYSGGGYTGGKRIGGASYGSGALLGGSIGHTDISSFQGANLFAGRQLYAGHGGLIPAAITSRRQIQFYDVPSNREDAEPLTIEVGSSPASLLNIKFRSSSSPINVDQDHEPAPGSVRETSSEDEPHRLIHTVTRPIFQEVHEVIKPFRKVTQEVQPVVEDIQTVVAKGDEVVGLSAGVSSQGISGGQLVGGGYTGGAHGGSIVGVSKPSYSTGVGYTGAGYSSGYSKPAGYGGAVLGGGRHGGAHGGLEQVQVPFARRAAAARRAARA